MKRIVLIFLALSTLIGCSAKLPDLSTVEKQFYTGLYQLDSITLTAFAKELGGQLYSPKYDGVGVDSKLTVDGFVKRYQQLTQPYIWIQVTYQGKPTGTLPKSFQYYTELKQGKFSQPIKLFAGLGEYEVKVFVSGKKPNKSYYLFTSFQVSNQIPDIDSDIAYTLQAVKMKLHLNKPLSGYIVRNGTIEVSGTVSPLLAKKKLLIQVQKGKQMWQRVILISRQATFRETIPLLYGQGVHQIQIMLPYGRKKNYYSNSASFYVENETKDSQYPIQYSVMYEQRGVHLTNPIVSGGQGEYFYPIKGYLDANADQASKTTHLIVQTKKGSLVATYFVPIDHYRFQDSIPLRFGAGKYDVIVFVPEITSQQRDYFRFYMVAKFQVNSFAKEDKRDLLPSRGIESDNPKIQKLAEKITASADNNYDRSKLIFRYVARTMYYDVGKFEENSFAWDDSALKMLQFKKGVCQDYVFLTLSLLRAIHIPARFVEGVANSQNHAWVEAKVEGRWIIMDPTWGSGYIDPNRGFIKHYDGSFFDMSPKKLAKTHKRTGVIY